MKRSIRRIDPIGDLRVHLLDVEKPARYLGGEAGSIRKSDDSQLTVALCFPDLYEIGMSNNAIRILYSGLNALPDVRAERVFAPAPDFEALLERERIPLYTLESGFPLCDVDILGFSLGYELAATSMLCVLNSGRIPILAADRTEEDPIVIAGGPAVSNPLPNSMFIDAAYIGEAEDGFFELAEELAISKKKGATRSDLLARLAQADSMWIPKGKGGAHKNARRAIFRGFSTTAETSSFPIPSVRAVQNHGTVEIMRGCPNGCRFCHAGYYYRPQRAKPYEVIRREVEALICGSGFREITLASLSSGDYPGIGSLLDKLNGEWSSRHVSFQLPSLRINSFTLPIVRKLAEVRKSGLTFAVETPVDEWQKRINKDVSFEKTIAILEEARSVGFRKAKFYFMLGLPVPEKGIGEAQAIVSFFENLCSRINIQINVNVGTFVPKPHTPFQWAAQLTESEAMNAFAVLRAGLRRFKNIKLSTHSPFISMLEGVIARGDERVGELIHAAFLNGARLDAWEEHFDRELWRKVLDQASWPVVEESCGERGLDTALPWDDINIRVSKEYLKKELSRSLDGISTSGCIQKCSKPCSSCDSESGIDIPLDPNEGKPDSCESHKTIIRRPSGRIVFKYTKLGLAAFLQHLSIVEAFERAFVISGLDICYSEGFNPMPRFETTSPLPIAVESVCEIASVLVASLVPPADFVASINAHLPDGLHVIDAIYAPVIEGKKIRTIGSLEWGSLYSVSAPDKFGSESLGDKLLPILQARGLPDCRISVTQRQCLLFLRFPSKKEQGLISMLEAAIDSRPVQSTVRITRTELFAWIGAGEACSFFDAYERLESM